jgi:hypothetical protein
MDNFGGEITKRPRRRRRPRVTSVRVMVGPSPSAIAVLDEPADLGTIYFNYLVGEKLEQSLFDSVENYQISIACQLPIDENSNLEIPVLIAGYNISVTPVITNEYFSYTILKEDVLEFFQKVGPQAVNVSICYNMEIIDNSDSANNTTVESFDAFGQRTFTLEA